MKARLAPLARLASSRAFIAVVALTAIVLLLPTLRTGFMMDDYALPIWLGEGPSRLGGPKGVWDMFRFQDATPGSLQMGIEKGYWPWWTNPELRLAFLRPVTSLTHFFDYRVLRAGPAFMRLESILMYGAVVAVVAALYRRMLGATVVAGLAMWMYAIDDAHAVTTVWIANRNAVLAAGFGFGALLLHDRGIRGDERRARIAAPIVFAVAVLAGEAALATLGYLVAHAVWLQKGTWQQRVKAIAPYVGVAAVWSVVYKLGGYGASGGEFYIDPGKEPLRFLGALATRIPILLHGQMSFPPSDMWMLVPFEKHPIAFPIVAVTALLGAIVLVFGLRRTNENAFFATGMLLALVPVCATFPGDRLLMFAGFGAFGLVADFVTAARDELPYARRIVVKVAAVYLVGLHVVMGPLTYAVRGTQIAGMLHDPVERAMRSLPPAKELEGKTLVLVNAPDFLIGEYAILARALAGEPMPERIRQLTIAVQGRMLLTRTSERKVEVLLSQGFFHEPFSLVFRKADDRLELGERFELPGMTVTVMGFTRDRRRVNRVEFEMDAPLDDPRFVWVVWKGTGFERMQVPAVGAEEELPVVDYMVALQGK